MTDNCIEKLRDIIEDSEFTNKGIDSLSIDQILLFCINIVGYDEVLFLLKSKSSKWWELQSTKLRDKIEI